jgi:hypothetical protein
MVGYIQPWSAEFNKEVLEFNSPPPICAARSHSA